MTASPLSTTQYKALTALLAEPTIKEAAQVAGLSERTVYRYLLEPSFEQAYRKARRQAVAQATTRLQQVSAEAVDTLHEIMTDRDAPARARVAAASKILDLAYKAIELEDLEGRIKALEEQYGRS